MYCKDCKFYKYDRTDEISDENYYNVKFKIKRGKCYNENLRYGYELENESQLIYLDSDDYAASLYVGELFGCVHFKEKKDIQKLCANIEFDFKCLYSVLNRWKEIFLNKHINKDRFNQFQLSHIKSECDQFVHDCKMLLEEIEIHETRSK